MFLRLVDLRCAHLFNLLVLVGLSSHLQRNWRTWIGFPIVTEQNIKRKENPACRRVTTSRLPFYYSTKN